MPSSNQPPSRPGRPVLFISIAVLAIAVIIFIGFNVSHIQTKDEQDQGEVAPSDRPQTPNDLTKEPVHNGS